VGARLEVLTEFLTSGGSAARNKSCVGGGRGIGPIAWRRCDRRFDDLVAGKESSMRAVKRLEANADFLLRRDWRWTWRDRHKPVERHAKGLNGRERMEPGIHHLVKERAGVKEKGRCQGKSRCQKANRSLQSKIGARKGLVLAGGKSFAPPTRDQNALKPRSWRQHRTRIGAERLREWRSGNALLDRPLGRSDCAHLDAVSPASILSATFVARHQAVKAVICPVHVGGGGCRTAGGSQAKKGVWAASLPPF